MAWKIYFWILLLLLLLSYAAIFTGAPSIWDVFDIIISLAAITGLFAYAYKKKVLTAKFWSITFLVIIAWDLTYNLVLSEYLGVAQNISGSRDASPIQTLVGLALVMPEYIALYLLAFKSDTLWKL